MTSRENLPGPGIAVALRRIALGYRVVGALWLSLLAAIALSAGAVEPLVAGLTVVLAVGWSALSLGLAAWPRALGSWMWLGADVAVAAVTVLGPAAAGTMTAFYGGYPFSAVVLAAYTRGMAGGVGAAAVLAAATIARLGLVGGAVPLRSAVETGIFYLVSAAILAWGHQVLLRTDAQRRAAEAALADERAERIRSQERAETAAHLHDSVLQTLALIQRQSADPARVTALARHQERELRDWLFGARAAGGSARGASFAEALRRATAEVEELHGVHVELVTVGDSAVDEHLAALVAAGREALVNAARHAGVATVSVYAEVSGGQVVVFVRDRGAGFEPGAVAADRGGIAESIVGRLERHRGRAVVRSAPGEGTEVEMVLPRGASVP